MEDSLLALQSMIENLATVAKLDAGTVRPVSAPTALGPLVLAMAAAASAIDPHLRVETHIEPTSIFTDRVMLGKLTSWLAINTAHMARTGSIEFHCRQVGAGAHLECHYTAPPPVGTQLDGIFVEVKAAAPTSLARSVVPGLGFCSTYARHLAAELGYKTETLDRQTICLKVHELDQVSPEG